MIGDVILVECFFLIKEVILFGLDFGSDFVWVLVVDCQDGIEIDIEVVYYFCWQKGFYSYVV